MGHAYRAVGWNRQKLRYDAVLGGGVLLYLAAFAATTLALEPHATPETIVIRASGTAAYFLLHVILGIGPLARLDRRCLPLLYNRRHLGVTTFMLALVHGATALIQFHGAGSENPFVSLFTAEARFDSLDTFPFQPLGAAALAILFLMAATSHDFWLANLGAPVWKALHMLVYAAYALLVLHVALGALQSERSPWLAGLAGAGLAAVLGLHLAAAWRERGLDRARDGEADAAGYVDVCAVDEIPEGRARIACLAGERVAVFRYGGKLAALSNACQHQNGPLGEGRVVDGCVTCPWHGYQYDAETGASPAPFTEAVPTFDLRVEGRRVLVSSVPNPPGTRAHTAEVDGGAPADDGEFYIGWQPRAPRGLARRTRVVAAGLVLLGAGAAFTAAAAQRPFAPARFEFGIERTLEGFVDERPHPTLRVPDAPDGFRRYLLVGEGKHGAEALVAGLDGRRARIRGSLLEHGGRTMLEVHEAAALEAPDELRGSGPPGERAELGPRTLRGEIADSKCHLGAMNPGRRKVHRACAINCIAGGIPPVLLVDRADGGTDVVLLVGRRSEAVNQAVLGLVGVPVEVSGELAREDDLLILAADPTAIRRLE